MWLFFLPQTFPLDFRLYWLRSQMIRCSAPPGGLEDEHLLEPVCSVFLLHLFLVLVFLGVRIIHVFAACFGAANTNNIQQNNYVATLWILGQMSHLLSYSVKII